MSSSLLDSPQDGETVTAGVTPPASTAVPAAPAGDPDEEQRLARIGVFADALGRMTHTVHRARAHLVERSGEGAVDWTARIALGKVVMTGPKRVSELADLLHVDASTMSRQVAAMVKDGLLTRQADPGDGRASLVVATDAGRAAVDAARASRNQELSRLLVDWHIADFAAFTAYLDRFAGDLDAHLRTDPAAERAATHSTHAVTDQGVPQ